MGKAGDISGGGGFETPEYPPPGAIFLRNISGVGCRCPCPNERPELGRQNIQETVRLFLWKMRSGEPACIEMSWRI